MASVNGVNVLNSVNFRAGEINDKTSSPVNDNKPSNDKKMKTATKLMIGATALATAVIAGIAIKKSLNVKNIKKASEESLKLINDAFKEGNVVNCGKEVKYESIAEYASEMKNLDSRANKAYLNRLDENGIKKWFGTRPEPLKDVNDGVFVALLDKDNNLVSTKAFIGDGLNTDLAELFGNNFNVVLK